MNGFDPALAEPLERLVPSFEGLAGDWEDALRRGGAGRRRVRPLLVAAAAALVLGVLATTSFG
jgi:hypothetical protein